MLTPRAGHANVLKDSHIYIFGGNVLKNDNPNACEVFSIIQNKWKSLPELDHAMSCTTAVTHGSEIWINSAEDRRISAYNPKQNKYRCLDIRVTLGQNTCMINHNNCMYIINEFRNIVKVSGPQDEHTTLYESGYAYEWINSTVAFHEGKYYMTEVGLS